jgi:hypothetical protein
MTAVTGIVVKTVGVCVVERNIWMDWEFRENICGYCNVTSNHYYRFSSFDRKVFKRSNVKCK